MRLHYSVDSFAGAPPVQTVQSPILLPIQREHVVALGSSSLHTELGPLLINDIDDVILSKNYRFADDTKLHVC